MDKPRTFPNWLHTCKEDFTETKEWKAFLVDLNDTVQQQLAQSHVQFFNDLSVAEQELFIHRATRLIEGGTSFGSMYSKLSAVMDQKVNQDVDHWLMEDAGFMTKTDFLMENIESGIVSLLRKWPEMKTKLHVCFNKPLQEPLRSVAWRLFLSDSKVRKTYTDVLNGSPLSAVSPLDVDISQKCEQLLMSEPTFINMKGCMGAFYAMKAVLSYYHAIQRSGSRLRDTDFMLVMPFVQMSLSRLSKHEPAPDGVVALIVEEFIVFMNSRPGFMLDSGSELSMDEMGQFAQKVAVNLFDHYPDVAKAISWAYLPAKEKIVATETGSQALVREGLTELLHPIVSSMLTGYLQMDTLLYVWDQYLIGLYSPGFGTGWLVSVCTALFGLLKGKVKDVKSPVALETVLRREALHLTVQQFQFEVKHNYYDDLYSLLVTEQKFSIPVLDPTQAGHPPWRHWLNDLTPPYTKPFERRRAREQREIDRERLIQEKHDANKVIKEQQQMEKKQSEERSIKLMNDERCAMRQEQHRLENELNEERQLRLINERQSQEQIDVLRRQLAILRCRPNSANPSMFSVSSYLSRILIPPPPTPASDFTGHAMPLTIFHENLTETESLKESPTTDTKKIIMDFLGSINQSLKTIAHGAGSECSLLDQATERYLSQNMQDLKQAQLEVFGHYLQPGEFETMSPGRQKEAGDHMMHIIQQWRQTRPTGHSVQQ